MALMGGGIFYLAYGEWFSFLVLVLLLGLPWLSLVVSLPAMITFRGELGGAALLTQGQEGELWLLGSSRYPIPPFLGRIRLVRAYDGQSRIYDPALGLETEHCGGFAVTVEKLRVCDYLGLFAVPVKGPGSRFLRVRPLGVPVSDPPDLSRIQPRAWIPKPGGGFGENHDLRLYRPGDSRNQIHWKLSAKTGKLIIREPLLPRQERLLLTLTLRGSDQELDRKLGRLLWLGRFLLDQSLAFEIQALTGEGVRSWTVTGETSLDQALDALLASPGAKEGSIADYDFTASWQYHIGGEPDEP